MTETYKKQIVQQIIRNQLDIQLLRIVQAQPTWGYSIKKKVDAEFNIKLRHGALYPTLNQLKKKGFLASTTLQEGRRRRKVYTITEEGKLYLQTYNEIMKTFLNA